MCSRLCMCDACTEGRLLKGEKKQGKRKRKKKKKIGKNVPRRASASRFSSTLDPTQK